MPNGHRFHLAGTCVPPVVNVMSESRQLNGSRAHSF
jgi:hypothetical protein